MESRGLKRPLRAISGRVDEMAPLATFETCRLHRAMPVVGANPEDICFRLSSSEFDPSETFGSLDVLSAIDAISKRPLSSGYSLFFSQVILQAHRLHGLNLAIR